MKMYYYMDQGTRMGPFPIDQLPGKNITLDTFVWCEGMENWKTAREVPELDFLFNPGAHRTPPPISGMTGNQGYGNQGFNRPPRPETYLVWAILTTILCCLPFGIVSIVYATKVDSAYNNGEYAEAEKYSNKAKTWAIVSALASVVISIIYLIFWAAALAL